MWITKNLKSKVLSNRTTARIFGRKYFGLNKLDAKLEQFIDYEEGYFVELGANDGVTQSNTKYFELFKNWKGVLIEPTINKYEDCKRNRNKRSHVVNAACVSFSNQENTVNLVYSNLMTTTLNTESDLTDLGAHLKRGRTFLEPKVSQFHFQARARTLNSILEEVNAPSRIDLLSLDVEGSEIEVLKGINHNQFRFSFICIECRDLPKMKEYLLSLNYVLKTQLSEHDYLFADSR